MNNQPTTSKETAMSVATSAPSRTQVEKLADAIQEALDQSRELSYQRGRYVEGAAIAKPDPLNEQTAVVSMWQQFYSLLGVDA